MNRACVGGPLSRGRRVRRKQRGLALLVMMLVLVMAGAALLLGSVSSAADTDRDNAARTTRALAEARKQLIAYALADGNRPGELPCPDIDRDGVALPGVEYLGNSCASLRGWLPWRTLDMVDAQDGSGSPLWYAVSDAFHANDGGALNPDTVGGLDVDGGAPGDVVAVIVAPGEARGGQARPATGADAATHVGAYLEGVNADGDPATWVTTGGGDFNDRVVFITAAELLRATEQRVLGEVAAALTAYRNANGAYPWLSPFRDPASGHAALFDGVPGTRIGHLPVAAAEDVGEPQDTGYTITWTAGDAPVAPVGTDSLLSGLLSISAIDLGIIQAQVLSAITSGSHTFPTPTSSIGNNSSCTAQRAVTAPATAAPDPSIADCYGTFSEPAGYFVTLTLTLPLAPPVTIPLVPMQRDYTFDVSFSGTAVTGPHPGGEGHGVRSVDSGAVFQAHPPGSSSTITVRDYIPALPAIQVTRRMTITDGSTATVDVDDIYLEPSPAESFAGDLPAWFFTQGWHRYVLAEYAGNALPVESMAAGNPCSGAECVSLEIRDAAGALGATRTDLAAVVTGAGLAIGAQDRTSGAATLADYFELANADDGDRLAERRVRSSTVVFNDQVRIVDPAPLP